MRFTLTSQPLAALRGEFLVNSRLAGDAAKREQELIFSWFSTREAREFGASLAKFIMGEMPADARTKEAKFAAKAGKTLQKAARQLQDFKAAHKLNPYKKAKLANAFLWGLRDARCPAPYADELTEWLTLRL